MRFGANHYQLEVDNDKTTSASLGICGDSRNVSVRHYASRLCRAPYYYVHGI